MLIKRIFDLCASVVLIVMFLPLMGLIAILILLCMGRPVLYRQERPGLHGKPFTIFKFRTMDDRKNSNGQLLPDEARLTSVGKFLRTVSLDELPQLFNVAKGELSFVGPRPLLMEYLPLYSKEQARRHDVPPGITGWAQVNGRNAITWNDRFRFDVWYVDNRSFFLDMKILWFTILKTIKREGVSAEGHATMPKFTGSSGEHN